MKRFIGASLVLLTLLLIAFITPQTAIAQEDYPLESGGNSSFDAMTTVLPVLAVVYCIIIGFCLIVRKASDFEEQVARKRITIHKRITKLLTMWNKMLLKGYLAAFGVGILLGAITGNWWMVIGVVAAPLGILGAWATVGFVGSGSGEGIIPEQVGFVVSWVDYLLGRGVKAEVVELRAPVYGHKFIDTIVRLTGKNVDEIWILPRSRGGQMGTIEWDTHFRLLLDRPLSAAIKKAVTAKSIIGHEITDVKWVGGGIVHDLNQDTDLRMMLLAFVDFFSEIRIEPKSKSAVTIIVRCETIGGDYFEIFDRIAKHVRDVVGKY